MGGAIAELHRTNEIKAGHTPEWPISRMSFAVEGELYHVSPLSVSTNSLNFTSFPGKCSGTLFSLLFWLGKNEYKVYKVDDTMEISPMHQQYYQITIQQKQKLEKQIKEGLAGISSAITDFELLFHDLRKYKEFVDYFKEIEEARKANDEERERKANQSLKSVFIDQVDVHTGEGVSLKHIAPRWPTIISDFMRMEDGDDDPKEIAKKYKVSEAEGVVLATKNKLFVDWKEDFKKIVNERYRRIFSLVQARKFSVDEYKNMLKPYIARYKSLEEKTSKKSGRDVMRSRSWLSPGAQATSIDWTTLCAFKTIPKPEPRRVTFERFEGSESVLKMDFCPSFKKVIKDNIEYLRNNSLGELPLSKTGIEPLDKWVWALYKYIEKYYSKESGFQIRFSLEDLLRARNDFVTGWGSNNEAYFKCFEMDVERAIIKLPDGTELEDITFSPIYLFLETQNMMLLRFLERKAQEKVLEKYIDTMLGDTSKNKKLEDILGEYDDLFRVGDKTEKEKEEEIAAAEDLRRWREKLQPQINKEVVAMRRPFKLFKQGHYEPSFEDVITGPYFSGGMGASMVKLWNFLKAKFDVPGFSVPGVKG